MRYDYECGSCGLVWEHSCPMSQRPDTLACKCGGTARQVILSVPHCHVKFGEYRYNKAKNVPSMGARFGRSPEQQHETYRRIFDAQRKQVAAERRSLSKKDGVQYLGGMPAEMAMSIGEHENDPEAVMKDPVPFLKMNGLYMGD